MRLGVLGPLLVVDEGREFRVSAARQRILLAALAVRANRIVPVDELAEIVWDGAPTPMAARTLRSYVVRLRRTVGAGVAARILTRDPGYLCQLADDESDLRRFETACRQAAAAARSGRWDEVSAAATDALDLWRGDPLVDVPSELLRGQVVPRLEQLRLQALEDRAEADLLLRSRANLVPQLRELTAAYPLRERFHAQLMRALASTGQHAEALAVYRDARRTLTEELGIEPGPELRELHEKILANEPTLTESTVALTATAAPASAVVPRQLPAGIRHFTGRTAELKMLTTLLGPAGWEDHTVAISLIEGTAGVGKTALAVQWAHQHAGLFPDGQLYVNLLGFDPAGPPMPAATAVRRILDALAVPAAAVPADTDAQFDLYRSLVADRRLLIVLDNARDAEQVRPLLPGAVGCRVLVTSRNRLTSLIALDGAIPLTVDLLSTTEARELLIRRLGPERVAREDRAADELIDACARLPLALNVAAAHVATHPVAPLDTLAAQLRDAHQRLDLLSTGHAAGDLRAVFSWSYRALSEPAAYLFGLLGVHPGPDITLPAAAGLAALDRDQTHRALDELTAAHLLTEHAPGRYALHDLLRAYATEQATRTLSAETRTAAVHRVVDFYLHTAYAGDRLLQPARDRIQLDAPTTGCVPDPPTELTGALAWFDAEHACLLATQRLAATIGRHASVWQLAWALNTFHERRGHNHDDVACWLAGLAAVERLPDPAPRALVYERLGRAYALAGHHVQAREHLRRALNLAEHADDASLRADVHTQLGLTCELRGEHRRSITHYEHALRQCRTLADPRKQARALCCLAWAQAQVGDYTRARDTCEQALNLARRHDDHVPTAAALDTLGYIAHHTGRLTDAIDHYHRALQTFRAVGSSRTEADIHASLGDIHAALGHHADAGAAWQRALDLYRAQHRATDAERVHDKLVTAAGR